MNQTNNVTYATDPVASGNVADLDYWSKVDSYNESLSEESYSQIDNLIGYITIDRLNITYPIYKGTDEDTLNNGIGHVFGTSLPNEEASSACLSGHNGLYGKDFFTHLDKLEIGDEVQITAGGKTLIYVVYEKDVVLPENVTFPNENKSILTLMTCTPYGVNTHRLLVRCELRKENA